MITIRKLIIFLLLPVIICVNGIPKSLHGQTSAQAEYDTINKNKIAVPFNCVLTEAINKAIPYKYKYNITLISYPSQGNLMWYYQNINGIFNQATFDYISARISAGYEPCLAQMSYSGTFPNAYSSVIPSIYYNLSSTDKQRISNNEKNAQNEANQLINSYENNFGAISEKDFDNYDTIYGKYPQGKLDYIIGIIAGSWSGHDSSRLTPLSYSQMRKSPDLNAMLPNMPAKGAPVVENLSVYLDKVSDNDALFDSLSNGLWTIRQLKNNTWHPNDTNGGMKTVNPFTGAVSAGYQVGYQVANSISNIQNDLSNTNKYIDITMHMTKTGNCEIVIVTSWNTGMIDTITYSLPDSVYVDMYPISTGMNDEIIELLYGGFTMVSTSPALWNDRTNTGWYFGYPINQAIKNGTSDVTGYKFISWPPAYDMSSLSDGGTFGYITHLLICNYEKMSITMGDFGNNYTNGTSDIAFPVVSVPQMQQTAYVIGGDFCFPQSEK